MREKKKFYQIAADFIVNIISSWKFLIIQSVILTGWVILNTIVLIQHWDNYPFILMNLFLSMQAAYTAPIILMAQRRTDEKSREIMEKDFKTDRESNHMLKEMVVLLEGLLEEIKKQPKTQSHLRRHKKTIINDEKINL